MTESVHVPTIDVSPLFDGSCNAKMRVASEIDAACRGVGFFYAARHGIDVESLEKVTTDLHRTLTHKEKWELAIRAYNPTNPRSRNGYYMAVQGKKAPESYCYLNPSFTDDHPRILAATPMHEVNLWPDAARHPGIRDYYENYFWRVFGLSTALLRGFALALGRDERFFEPYFAESETLSAVSLIRYPYLQDYPPVQTATDGTKLSFGDHLDVSLITVLYQTPVPNLQVETPVGYQNVPTSGDHYLVNCGTYMAYITNGYYPAPRHRVAFINGERLSIPFFVNLGHDSEILPFTPQGSKECNAKAPVPYGRYLRNGLSDLIVSNGQT